MREVETVGIEAGTPEAPQGQLSIRTDVALNEVFQLARHRAVLKAEAAQYFLRDSVGNILRPIGLRLHNHAPRIAVLAGH